MVAWRYFFMYKKEWKSLKTKYAALTVINIIYAISLVLLYYFRLSKTGEDGIITLIVLLMVFFIMIVAWEILRKEVSEIKCCLGDNPATEENLVEAYNEQRSYKINA